MRDATKHDTDGLRVGVVLDEPFANVIRNPMLAGGSLGQSVGQVIGAAVSGREGGTIRFTRDAHLVLRPVRGHPHHAANISGVVELLVKKPVNASEPNVASSGRRLASRKRTKSTQTV